MSVLIAFTVWPVCCLARSRSTRNSVGVIRVRILLCLLLTLSVGVLLFVLLLLLIIAFDVSTGRGKLRNSRDLLQALRLTEGVKLARNAVSIQSFAGEVLLVFRALF